MYILKDMEYFRAITIERIFCIKYESFCKKLKKLFIIVFLILVLFVITNTAISFYIITYPQSPSIVYLRMRNERCKNY